MAGFVHLHLHSEYSLLDGACRISEIPKRAAESGHTAVALTDHGNMYGAVAFYQACRKEGVKPIIGCEVYVASGSRFERTPGADGKANHLVLLCENEQGYRNLIWLVSKGYTEGFYSKPRIDMELLREHSEGLIALSACLAGKIPSLLLRGEYDAAKQYAMEMRELFGEDRFYIELQNHGLNEQIQILPELWRLAQECGIGVVATNDCHYLRRENAQTQAVLMCIQTNTKITDGRPIGFETDEFYYKTTDEMRMLFAKYEGALENTVKIAERCNFEFHFDAPKLPSFPTPDGKEASAYLRELTEEGLQRRLADGTLVWEPQGEQVYRDRISYELGVIAQMGYSDYFLIVQDYVNYARSHNIPVGPGRGSGAGSLVAFLIGITDVDPIKFDLLFERFLNPERVSMPDIDVDFCYNRRDEVIRYMFERYGNDHVAQIIAFGTLAARAAVRDVGRAQDLPYADVDAVARAIPQELGITLRRALELPELKTLYDGSDKVKKLVDTALELEGMPRNVTVHAAGIVVTDLPVTQYVPLAVSNSTVVTQFDMDTIAHLGLLKFDFLALRYLTIIQDTCDAIREEEPSFDLKKIPFDDAATFETVSQGKTLGLFQLESSGMRQMLTELMPDCLEDIIAAIALYRPGPMDSIPQYIEARHHPERVKYAHPALEPILRSTYGCTVYQEQVMSIFRVIAGYTYGHADIVRRAMAKKKADVLKAERESFLSGAAKNGVAPDVAERLFDDMESFANYAFNKSHAAAYAVISYQTAYLKTHYPRQYMAALMTSVLGNLGKLAEYIAECTRYGIRVMPPDINESRLLFHATEGGIVFGLLALKNVGRQFIDSIIQERKSGRFRDFEDFVRRMAPYELNRRMVESLIKAGAFDNLGVYRSRLLASYEKLIDISAEKNRNNLVGQLDMFSIASDAGEVAGRFEYPPLPDFSLRDKLMLEKESSGMYFSGHLLDSYSRHVEALGVQSISELSDPETVQEKQAARIAGIVSAVTYKTTRKNEKMAFIRVEDRYGEMECLIFPGQLAQYAGLIHADAALLLYGNLSVREDEPVKMLVSGVEALIENSRYSATSQVHPDKTEPAPAPEKSHAAPPVTPRSDTAQPIRKVYLRVPDKESRAYRKAMNLVEIFEGGVRVIFFDKSTGTYTDSSVGVTPTPFVLGELRAVLGEENVVVR